MREFTLDSICWKRGADHGASEERPTEMSTKRPVSRARQIVETTTKVRHTLKGYFSTIL